MVSVEDETDECQFLNSFFGLLFSSYLFRGFVSSLLILLVKELTMGICTNRKRLDGKVVLITGANSGIGFETALDLAKRGAKIYLACRNKTRAVAASQAIIMKANCDASKIKILELDLTLLKSVRKCADEFLAVEKQLDILINNAGVPSGWFANQKPDQRQMTKDKLELVMQTNHFGHFLLTNLLKPALQKAEGARVINVSSLYSKKGILDVDNLNGEKHFNGEETYANSKLANVVFSKELAKRWSDIGVSSYSVHPGFVRSEISKKAASSYQRIHPFLAYPFGKNCKQGAQTTLHCCVADDLVNGAFYLDCRQSTMLSNRAADGGELGSKFWLKSSALVRL